MARTGMKNTMMLFMKPSIAQRGLMPVSERSLSKLNPTAEDEPRLPLDDLPTSCWVPHPRSGIYFPKGQERVMNDIPDQAASLDQTFWLRNIDGVDFDKQESFTADATENNAPK